jgi:gas vesicle protein
MFTTPLEPPEGDSEPKTHAAGSPYRNVTDKRTISMLGLGMVIGAAIGAGIALTAVPRSGEETRDRIRDSVRPLGRRDENTWERLGRELRRAASLRRKELIERRTRHEKATLERQRAEQDAGVKPA